VERLIVARHGESDYSARGLLNGDPNRRCPLTATGRRQALRLGELLREERIDLCVTSAFERTRETADLALAGRQIPRLVVAELNDHPAGEFEGSAIAEYLVWAHASPSDDPIPGASESRLDALRRFGRGYRLVQTGADNDGADVAGDPETGGSCTSSLNTCFDATGGLNQNIYSASLGS